MARHSAGIVLFRQAVAGVEVFLVHPGGPFWAKKDAGAWSIPKGEFDPGEDALAAARREFTEETGSPPPVGDAIPLGEFRQPSGKIVHAFAIAGDFDLAGFRSNTFPLEWPPRSGRMIEVPEADRAAWFGLAEAVTRVTRGQRTIIEAVATL